MAYFGYFVANLPTFWCTYFTGLHNAVVYHNGQKMGILVLLMLLLVAVLLLLLLCLMTSFSCWTTPSIALIILCHWRCCCDCDVFVVVMAIIVVFDNIIHLFVDLHMSHLCKDLYCVLLVMFLMMLGFGSLADDHRLLSSD